MSKLALVADIHLEGKNLDNKLACLREMVAICRKEKVDYILNAGDTFDRGEVGDYIPAEVIISKLEEVMNIEIPIITIEGNHDQWGLTGSGLDFIHFQNWIKVKDEVKILGFKDFEVACIPWIRIDKDYHRKVMNALDVEGNPNKCRIILGHLNIIGCAIGAHGYCDSTHYYSFGVQNFKNSKFNPTHMFFGHIHSQIKFDHQARYLGAFTQRRFNEDEGKPSGFYIFDTETGNLEFKCLDHIASRYFSIEESELNNYNIEKDFVRFYTYHPEKYSSFLNVKARLKKDVVENEVKESFKYDTLDINVLVQKYCEVSKVTEPTSAFYLQEKSKLKVGLTKQQTGFTRVKSIKLLNFGVHKFFETKIEDGYTVITGRNRSR